MERKKNSEREVEARNGSYETKIQRLTVCSSATSGHFLTGRTLTCKASITFHCGEKHEHECFIKSAALPPPLSLFPSHQEACTAANSAADE